MKKVDVDAFGIDTKLAKKYNAIVNFLKENTTYEDGCICAKIESIEYTRKNDPKSFKTIDHIKMVVKVFDDPKTLWINNPQGLAIDRKYNGIVRVGDLDV